MGTLINDCDKCLFDSVAQEVNKLAGTTGVIYQFEEIESTRDPLWDEEITTEYKTDSNGNIGISCPIYFRAPDRSSLTGEEGFRLDRNSDVQIAQIDLDNRGLRRLQSGDIVKVWGRYYDVVESHKGEGYISDSGENSMVKFDLVSRTKAPPESIWVRDV